MARNLPPPPIRPILFDIDRSNSPTFTEDSPPTAVSGLELTVYGLDKSTPLSAAEHLRRIFHELETKSPATSPFLSYARALVVRQADMRNALDYAFVSFDQEAIPQPRADLLQGLRQALMEAYPTLRVSWRVHAGLDKTRRITFAVDNRPHGEQVKAKLDEWLKRRNMEVLTSFPSSPGQGTYRLSYDLVDPEHVATIFQSPPVLDNRTYYPTRPRFVVPSYGYQIAALGCRDWQAAKPTLDRFIRERYPQDGETDPLSYSHMALDGDIYTAVLTNWDTAVSVAQGQDALEQYLRNDPIGRYINPPQLGLLYGLNSSGLFLRQGAQERTTIEMQQVRNEVDSMRQQGLEAMKTVYAVQTETNRMMNNVTARLEGVMSAIATVAASQSIQSQIAHAENILSELRHERSMSQLMTSMPHIPDDVRQQHLVRMRQYEEDIAERRRRLTLLQDQQAALNHAIESSLSLVGAPPGLPPPQAPMMSHSAASGASSVEGDRGSPPEGSGITHGAQGAQPMDEVRVTCLSKPLPTANGHIPGERRFEARGYATQAVTGNADRLCDSDSRKFAAPPCTPITLSDSCGSPLYRLLFLLLCISYLLPLASASSSFSALSINCNGLANVAKQAAVADLIANHDPHIWVINETKSPHMVRDRIAAPGYNKHESPGQKLERGRGGKWGVIVGVKQSLHAQRLEVESRYQGRVVALDVIIETSDGRGYTHRVIGVYAPWDPGPGSLSVTDFWHYISSLCATAPHSWVVIGDCNVTLSATESLAQSDKITAQRSAYRSFLRDSQGFDVWQTQNDADARFTYTCRASNGLGHSIIDRAAVSRIGVQSASIAVLADFVPATDHRPILSCLALQPPLHLSSAHVSIHNTPRPEYPPRFIYPRRNDKERFTTFSQLVDESVAQAGLANQPVVDDHSFDLRYNSLTQIFRSSGLAAFEIPQRGASSRRSKPTNDQIRALVTETRRVNRIIAAVKQHRLTQLSHFTWAQLYVDDFNSSPDAPSILDPIYCTTFVQYLAATRRTLCQLRYRAEQRELEQRATRSSRARINATLLGGSAKKLYVHAHDSDGPPAALSTPNTPPTFVTDADGIKRATVDYFSTLFHRQARPPSSKPWLNSPSVRAIREHTAAEPFCWPQPMTLQDLRFMLRKGNPRPSPGPDQWEKWCTKALSDSALTLVLDLVNYEITSSHFPASVKPTILSTIFKRGARTDLANYRGIACANLVRNPPFAWLNHLLSSYLIDHHILPPSQIATQPGVQARDLTSFLAQVDSYARRHKTPLYLLRRDQRKGFDRLEPDGFYDAVRAYGLPLALIDLDHSAQEDVPYRVKTVHGLTDSFILSGITQQGGSFSPLKSTLTTSMANHWLHDILTDDEKITFTSHQHAIGKPHTPDDKLTLHTQMVEAMDDSIIITPSLAAAQSTGLRVERFQAAYGWETNWSKSLLAVLGTDASPPSIQMPSVDANNPDSGIIIYHDVAVSTQHCEFLRVTTNDPDAQYAKIRHVIDSFDFPNLHTRLPLTALRRIIAQCLISRIRPYLSYQPISRDQADQLDRLIAERVHAYLAFPFRFNSALLYLPLNRGGFDFPSIARLNDTVAVQGLIRDLNHHVPTFRTMARITLADWTCMLNKCQSPLEGSVARSFARSKRILPFEWIVAHNALRALDLSIRCTDQSYTLDGDVSLRHLIRTLPPPPASPSSLTITNLERLGITRLADIASWVPLTTPQIGYQLQPRAHLSTMLQGFSASREWPSVCDWLLHLTLQHVTQAAAGLPPTAASCDDRWTLAMPRATRQALLEDLVRSGASLSPHTPLDANDFAGIIASDASAITLQYPNAIDSPQHVTFAVASTTTTFVLAISPEHRLASSLHGEIYGLIAAVLLHPSSATPLTLYTDHLNSVRFLENHSKQSSYHLDRYIHTPGLSLYRWLLQLLRQSPNPPLVTYTPAHTSSVSIPSQANDAVDKLSSSSHPPSSRPLAIPLPTFSLPDYVLHSPTHSYIESNIPNFLAFLSHTKRTDDPTFRPNVTLFRPLYNAMPPPTHPYVRASSAYSAAVQLYARSSQLDAAVTRSSRLGNIGPSCDFGCDAIGNAHHFFVHCPQFDTLRRDAKREITHQTAEEIHALDLPNSLSAALVHIAGTLFDDDALVWPQYSSHYYLGTMPPIPLDTAPTIDSAKHKRVLTRVVQNWHSASIRLAGRIWGEYKRKTNLRAHRPSSHTLSLPPHLSHLL